MANYNFRAPALPVPTPDYQQAQQLQLASALRLYFNRLDNYNILTANPAFGTTAARPAIDQKIGQFYFDTDLGATGLPIWWDGTNWIDASGTVV